MVYLGLIETLSDFGLGAAVVRFRDFSREQLAQFNTLAVGFGLACVAISLLMAMPLGHFFNEPRLPLVVAVLSSTDLIMSFRVVPQAHLQKRMEFRRLAAIDGMQSIAASIITVVLALLHWGYWALIFGRVLSALLAALVTCFVEPTPFRWPKSQGVRQPFTFSRHILTTRFAWYVYSNADFFIVGRFLGQAALGVYTLGWTLSGMAVEKISALIVRVTPAVFSATQHDLRELRRYLLLLTEVIAITTFPVCFGIAVTSDELVRVALGPGWSSAAIPLRLLAISMSLRAILPFVNQALAAIGQQRVSMQNALITACVLPLVFFFGSRWGLAGVAGAWLVLSPALALPLYLRAFRRLELPTRQYVVAVWPALSGSMVMVAMVWLADVLVVGDGWSPYGVLPIKVCAGALAYAATLVLAHGDRLRILRDAVRILRAGERADPKPSPAAVDAKVDIATRFAESLPAK